METRLKQRLTGAAILVALVVALVPEMFRGQHSDVAATTSSSGEGPPIRSYFIDLSNGATRTAPLQSAPASSSGSDEKPTTPAPTTPAVPDHPTPNGSASAAASPSTPPPVSAPAPAAAPTVVASAPNYPAAAPGDAVPAPSHHSTAPSTPARASVSAPAHAPSAPSGAAASAHTAPAPSHAGSSGGWGVQLGLFAKRDNAERLVRAAQDKGFSVSVSSPDARGLYRVYAGGMADRVAAEAYSQRLKDQGLPAAVVSLP
ncbi:MAG TPA: SPOR domain-containing protein [Steroidobacteraceae bacterium]|jgi:cell division septation protein DedD